MVDEILALSAPVQLDGILDFVFPPRLKGSRHVLGINIFAASTHLIPRLGNSLSPKQKAAHS